MGHIELAAPVTHIWYFKGVPEPVWATCSTWLRRDLEKVIYFAAYMITSVNVEDRHRDLPSLEARSRWRRRSTATAATPTSPTARRSSRPTSPSLRLRAPRQTYAVRSVRAPSAR
jgi:DNA-directed RNA polymerase beta' subunit